MTFQKTFIYLILFLGTISPLFTQIYAQNQPEIVPAENAVYDFLHLQRIAGLLPRYIHESRPVSRGEIIRHLETLQNERNQMGKQSWEWLQAFRQEFLEPADKIETVLGKGTGNERNKTTFHIPLGKDTEKFFYYRNEGDWRTAIETRAYGQLRVARKDDKTLGGFAAVPEVVFQGHYKDWFGFYSGTFDGWQLGGNTRVLKSDPEINTMYYIRVEDPPVGSFDRTSASMRLQSGAFFGEIANERLILGSSFSQPLVLAQSSDYLPFVRLGFQTSKVQFQFVHAKIGTQSTWKNSDVAGIGQLVAPERHLALHRITVTPSDKASFSFSEMVVYGLRGPEIAYLNPFMPFKTSEHALWDRDNTLFEVETVYRPKSKVETHASLVIDDLNMSLIGKHSYHVKWAFQSGIGVQVQDNMLASLEYTRIEPFTFTHRFVENGLYYNTYDHNGTPLSNPIGPNADQWNLGLKMWFPKRIRGEAQLFYNRQGENYTNADGTFVNVGGDLLNGGLTNDELNNRKKLFLDGKVQKGLGGALMVQYEPIRNLALRLVGNFQHWDSVPSTAFLRTEFVIDL
jgi:hypothetical protein